jgi:hypothetical protein
LQFGRATRPALGCPWFVDARYGAPDVEISDR